MSMPSEEHVLFLEGAYFRYLRRDTLLNQPNEATLRGACSLWLYIRMLELGLYSEELAEFVEYDLEEIDSLMEPVSHPPTMPAEYCLRLAHALAQDGDAQRVEQVIAVACWTDGPQDQAVVDWVVNSLLSEDMQARGRELIFLEHGL